MNGKTVCVDQNGDGKAPTEATKNKASKTTEKSTVTNADGSSTTTETTTETDANGNQKITTTKTTNKPDGSSSSKSETEYKGKNPEAAGKPGQPASGAEKGKCEKNSSDEGCGGSPTNPSGLYTAKDKGIDTMLRGHSSAISGSGLGGVLGNFFSVSSGGSCPTWSASIPFLKTTLTIDQFCTPFASNALLALKAAFLVAASFFAFRIALE